MEQVIGRARRICSHENLLEEEREVKVFLYLNRVPKIKSNNGKRTPQFVC